MSASKKLIQAAAGVGGAGSFYDYEIENSARFNAPDSPKLTKTFGTPTNNKKWTYSCWSKLSGPNNTHIALTLSSGTSVTNYAFITFYPDPAGDYFWYQDYNGSNTLGLRTYTKKIFRDYSSWYHVVVAVDTTQAISTDRVKVYFNGERYTDWDTSFQIYPAQNYDTRINNNIAHTIGSGTSDYTSSYVNGYLAEPVFIDGHQLPATDFGEFKNGVWIPKDVSGLTFGNNGFLLDFGNSAALGTDVSGNGNNFTTSGLTSSDQMIDTPSNNFATWNPLKLRDTASAYWPLETYSEGNLTTTHPSSIASGTSYTTVGVPDDTKMYCEIYVSALGGGSIGIDSGAYGNTEDASDRYLYASGGSISGPSSSTSGSSYTTGDIIGICIDRVSDEVAFYKNGSLQGTLSGLSDKPFFPFFLGNNNASRILNAGQNGTFNGNVTAGGNTDANGLGDFKYTVPTDALALCTANLPEPTIGPNTNENSSGTTSDENFNTVLYVGNGTAIGSGGKSVTGVGFQPDMVWTKNRDAAQSWAWMDTQIGTGKYWTHDYTSTGVITNSESLASMDSDGFTVGSLANANVSGQNYVAYCFKKVAGVFDTVGYSGTGSVQNISHNLGAVPKVIIVKRVINANTAPSYFDGGQVSDPETDFIGVFDTTVPSDSNTIWNDTAPTSTQFTVGTGSGINLSSDTYVAYLFAEVENFSSFGSYTGNGSSDGSFIYTGMRPAFLIVKQTNVARGWYIFDSARDTYNAVDDYLRADTTAAEANLDSYDFLSNGFKLRNNNASFNASGGTYIYMAFAENPFKYSNAR